MRRILLAAVLISTIASVSPAQAGWGHHCGRGGWGGGWNCGWGGGWNCGWGGGYRSCGWGGGWGWSGCNRSFSVGCCPPRWCGYTCYTPAFNVGCFPAPAFCNTGVFCNQPVGVGFFVGSTSPQGPVYNPQANFAITLPQPLRVSVNPAATPLLASTRSTLPYTLTGKPASVSAASVADLIELRSGSIKTVRVSNPEQYRRAAAYLAQGDELFRGQKFHSALQKYKLAAQAAPDMAEAFWRQGHALIATSNYDLAGGAFKRAIGIDPDIRRSGFSLDKLYGTASLAKNAHIEQLAAWAIENADSSNSFFLVGITLAYDGQAHRAAKFFRRAAEMAGIAGGHIAVFEPAAPAVVPGERRSAVVPVSAEVEI